MQTGIPVGGKIIGTKQKNLGEMRAQTPGERRSVANLNQANRPDGGLNLT